jgi:protein TonB
MSSGSEHPVEKPGGRPRFTINHGFAASLALHAGVALPFVLYALAPPPEKEPTLLVELQGAVSDTQSEEKTLQETRGEAKPDQTETPKPVEAPPEPPAPPDEQRTNADDESGPATPAPKAAASPPAADLRSGSAGSNNISGVEERQKAQTIKRDRDEDVDRLRDYIKQLTKKVQAKLVYPDEGRQAGLQGAATVSFAILRDGRIRPETLKIIASSGQAKLDASALKTIRASTPFEPPPREMTVAIAVAFGRKP